MFKGDGRVRRVEMAMSGRWFGSGLAAVWPGFGSGWWLPCHTESVRVPEGAGHSSTERGTGGGPRHYPNCPAGSQRTQTPKDCCPAPKSEHCRRKTPEGGNSDAPFRCRTTTLYAPLLGANLLCFDLVDRRFGRIKRYSSRTLAFMPKYLSSFAFATASINYFLVP